MCNNTSSSSEPNKSKSSSSAAAGAGAGAGAAALAGTGHAAGLMGQAVAVAVGFTGHDKAGQALYEEMLLNQRVVLTPRFFEAPNSLNALKSSSVGWYLKVYVCTFRYFLYI